MKKTSTIAFLLLAGIFINVRAQNYSKIISDYYSHKYMGKTAADLSHREWKITGTDPSQSMKATVLNLQQTIGGIPVMYGDAVLLVRGQEVITDRDNFLPVSPETAKQSVKASLSATAAFAAAGKSRLNPKFADTGELYFYPVGSRLVLAYVFIYQEDDLEKMLVVDANSGAVLRDSVTTLSCSFEKNAPGHNLESHLSFNGNKESNAAGATGASYNVFPLPVESPSFGGRSLVANPWLDDASPNGWHNDGTNDYNTTRGNNVYAYDDSAAANSPGNSPLATDLKFDYPLDLGDNAKNYKDAAITNLFYINNKAHDIFYRFGFTETAKNFQNSNFEKGGSGNDYVRAEAQDGGGLDNANFSSGLEGSTIVNPRMQMYLWSPKSVQNIYILEPASESGKQIQSKLASFGPALSTTPTAGKIVLSQPLDACTPVTNGTEMAGNIAVIERGNCNFVAKVKAAQDGGAKGVVIYNQSTTSTLVTMGSSDDTITIPSILITKEDGDYLKALMAQQPVKVSLEDDKNKYKYIDGALDNGIVIHEYGHGVTNRMTGTGYGCLDKAKSAEQMGEGWSDYFALMLTYQQGSSPVISRGIGTFAVAQATDGVGIRPAKYSPDFKINPYTYGKTNTMTFKDANGVEQIDVHSVGFVWATILWDMTLKMVDKYGYEPNVLASTKSGNARSLQLVMDALKLQGCNPTFINGRDAIIAADKAANGGDNECLIWSAFAKRGVGEKASAGEKTSIKDQVEDFTIPAKCAAVLSAQETSAAVKTPAMLFPNPATDEFYLKTGPVQGKIMVSIYDMAGSLISKNTISQGEAINVKNLVNGVYIVNAESLSFKISQKLIIKH